MSLIHFILSGQSRSKMDVQMRLGSAFVLEKLNVQPKKLHLLPMEMWTVYFLILENVIEARKSYWTISRFVTLADLALFAVEG